MAVISVALCLPTTSTGIWLGAWKSVSPSRTGWWWRNKSEDRARSGGELVAAGAGAWGSGYAVWADRLVHALLLSVQSWHSCYCPLNVQWQNSKLIFWVIHGSKKHSAGSHGSQCFHVLPGKGSASFVPALCLFYQTSAWARRVAWGSWRAEGDLGSIPWPTTTYYHYHLQRSSRRAGKQLCEDLREVQFKRFSIPEWNKSQGDLTIFLNENRKKKSYRDDSKASASVSAFLIFHLVLQHISLFKTGEEVILKHCSPERPKFSLLTLAKCLFSLFFFLLFFPPQNRFCPKGNTFKLNTFLWINWLFP